MLYFLPRSANSCGRFIIQYLDSSAGMVQPTLIVCWANAAPLLSSVPTLNAPNVKAAITLRPEVRFIVYPLVMPIEFCARLCAEMQNSCRNSALHDCFMLQMTAQYA